MTRAYVHLLGLMTLVTGRFEDRKDRGATAVEYGLLVGVIAIGLITAFTAFKGDLTTFFSAVANDLDGP